MQRIQTLSLVRRPARVVAVRARASVGDGAYVGPPLVLRHRCHAVSTRSGGRHADAAPTMAMTGEGWAADEVLELEEEDGAMAAPQQDGLAVRGPGGLDDDGGDDSFPSHDGLTPTIEEEYEQPFAAAVDEASEAPNEAVLSAIDMLCDDLFACNTAVLRTFVRTRSVTGATKSEMVLNLIERANQEAHGENNDLTVTKQLLGDVFNEDVRTSGVRSQWTNKALEASHIEKACEHHIQFELMSMTRKTMMVRRRIGEAAKVIQKLTRPFQEHYAENATAAVGGVFRNFKAEADALVDELPVVDVVSPFASLLVALGSYASSMNLFARTSPVQRLMDLGLVQPTVEDVDQAMLDKLMSLLDDVVAEVDQRRQLVGESNRAWGTETPEVFIASTLAFSESAQIWDVEGIPRWVDDMARMFNNWEAIVRNDNPSLDDVPSLVFNTILSGVASLYVLQRMFGNIITVKDVPPYMRQAVRAAFEQHYKDEEKAVSALSRLCAYAQVSSEGGKLKADFFAAVLSQMQSALSHHDEPALHAERVAIILRETCRTATRCSRSHGLYDLMVKLTEELRFHFRFQNIFKKLGVADRNTIRLKTALNMLRTLDYFETELEVTPISTKAVGFLVVQLLYLSMRSGGSNGSGRSVIEHYASVTGREQFAVVTLSGADSMNIRDLRVAFPPQLTYSSWLNQSDTKEKSVYTVLPSMAVKGATNQAMIISQAPMMRALDAISKVPWRINRFMLHVQEAIVREGYGFGKIRPGFYPLHYCTKSRGEIHHSGQESPICNTREWRQYDQQQMTDWKHLTELRSTRIHYLQALRQARSIAQFSHIYFPNSMDFRGRMYPLPGRLNHTGADPARGLLEYADPKPLGKVGLYWLKVHLANKMGMSKLSFDERAQYVDEHIEDVVRSAESPLHGDKWWQEAAEPMQCLMACKELADAMKFSQGPENFLSRIPVAVDGSYNGLQHYSAIGRDEFGAQLVNLVPSERPADAYTGILKEMMRSIVEDAARDNPVAQRCLGTGNGQDKDHIKRKTIKRPIMTQVYGVTAFGMSEQIMDELVKQNRSHGLWTTTDMKEMAAYVRDKVLESLGVTFRETQNCRRWIGEVTRMVWDAQPPELRNAFFWTTPLGLVVRQPYRIKKEIPLFTGHGYTRIPGDPVAPASRKQLTAIAPNLIHSLDATHLAMTAIEMQNQGLSMMAVHDSYWTYACDLPSLSSVLRQQFVTLYSNHDPLWEIKEQWEEAFYLDLRRSGVKLPDPPQRGSLDLNVVLNSQYFFS